jgi:short-subunit dehydrogenase involved in D-alanine esterification of teichoic acids
MHILITGGTAFIGTQITKYFTKLGFEFTILTRNSYPVNPRSKSVNFITELDYIVSSYFHRYYLSLLNCLKKSCLVLNLNHLKMKFSR